MPVQASRDELLDLIVVKPALYREFDLRTVDGIHIVVSKGTPIFAARSLGDIARQIGDHQHPDPARPSPRTRQIPAETRQAGPALPAPAARGTDATAVPATGRA